MRRLRRGRGLAALLLALRSRVLLQHFLPARGVAGAPPAVRAAAAVDTSAAAAVDTSAAAAAVICFARRGVPVCAVLACVGGGRRRCARGRAA